MKHQRQMAFILIAVSVFALFMGLRTLGALEYMELSAYDALIRWQPEIPLRPSYITLIRINEDDIQNYHWPLADHLLAQALGNLSEYGPRAIGLDIFKDIPVPPGEEELLRVMTSNTSIIVPMKFGEVDDIAISPPPALKGTNQVGFNDILVDPGGIVRRGLLFLDDGAQVYCSFALRLAALYLAKEDIFPQPDPEKPQHIRLGKATIRPLESESGGYVRADDQGYQFLLDYRRGTNPFPSYSLKQLMDKKLAPSDISGKAVIIGFDSEGVKDYFYTPFSHMLKYDQQTAGIALHAQIVDQLIRLGRGESRAINYPGEPIEIIFLLLSCALGAGLSARIRSVWPTALVVFLGVFLLYLASYLALRGGVWVPVVSPILAFVTSAAMYAGFISASEKKERVMLMRLFSQHVSPEIAEDIWRKRDQILSNGRPISLKLTDTTMFVDLSGFTSVSEKMEPSQLIDWLNTFLETMTQTIMEHGGIVDEFIGDGIKADFGIPIPRTSDHEIAEDANKAVKCALAMEKELNRLNAWWQKQNMPTVRMRVGIFTGQVVAGSLGSSQRLQYTTVGDSVNIASRLESLNLKEDGSEDSNRNCRILIGQSTLDYLDDHFETRKIAEVCLRGRREKTNVYRVLSGSS